MKKISVIVPVCNAEQYLSECIESILKQKKTDIEILLIDDGSKDGSTAYCDKYARENENVQVLHQERSGAGAARNAGLQMAQGDYIVFVDSDDYLKDENILADMEYQLETAGADIVVGNYMRLWNGKILEAGSHSSFSSEDRESGNFRFSGFFSKGNLAYVWGKMYRRSFLDKNGIKFGAYAYAEDKMFNFRCYICGAKYTFLEQYGYVYRKNDKSVSNIYRSDSMECWLKIAGDLQAVLEKDSLIGEYSDLVSSTILFAAFFDGKMVYQGSNNSLTAVKREMKAYGSDALAKKYFAQLSMGKGLRSISTTAWKIMFWGFSVLMRIHFYSLLAFGIKLLVDFRIDERLSDTGLREE